MENKKFTIREETGPNTWALPDYGVKVTEVPGEGTLIEAPEELAPVPARHLGEYLRRSVISRLKSETEAWWGEDKKLKLSKAYYHDDHGHLVTLIVHDTFGESLTYAKVKLSDKNWVSLKVISKDPLPDAVLAAIGGELRNKAMASMEELRKRRGHDGDKTY